MYWIVVDEKICNDQILMFEYSDKMKQRQYIVVSVQMLNIGYSNNCGKFGVLWF